MGPGEFQRGGAENAEVAETSKLVESERTNGIIAAAIEVHRHLGPGLLESVYQRAMAHELSLREIPYRLHCLVPVRYKGFALGSPLQLDLLVNERVVVEIKAVKALEDVHRAQLLSYLRLAGLETGLLINFNHPTLRQGVARVVNTLNSSASSASSAPPR
jgi:GxxExxY protein